MDAATIQAKIFAGRAKAALRIGYDCQVFRPTSVTAAPLASPVTTLRAAFNAADGTYKGPSLYGKPVWFGDLDGSQVRPGDYLVRTLDGATFFVAAMQPLLPIVLIDCPRTLRVTRQQAQTAVGAVSYGGLQVASEAPVLGLASDHLTYWPASILMGKSAGDSLNLPGSAATAGWRVLLPPSVPVVVMAGDTLTDDLGRRFMVNAAELTDLGWRINAGELHA
jgi:hypothetical protein